MTKNNPIKTKLHSKFNKLLNYIVNEFGLVSFSVDVKNSGANWYRLLTGRNDFKCLVSGPVSAADMIEYESLVVKCWLKERFKYTPVCGSDIS